jgi:drug/metabolite transporter (DMT)-like permease
VGIALGLGAALSWGVADYFAAIASRRIGTLAVVLGFHVVAMVLLAILVLATDGLAHLRASDLPLFVGLGAIGWLSYVTFYAALAIGPISVLSPIVSGYAAVTVLLAVLINGESLNGLETLAVVMTIAGVMVSSADIGQLRRVSLERRQALGLVLAIAAMALLGGFVFGVADRHATLGWLAPIFLARGFATVFIVGQAAREGLRWPAWTPRIGAIVVLLGVVDTAGYVCFNVGSEHAATSIVAAASAPYALIPVAAGVLALGERPGPLQRAGVVLVIGGLIVLGLAQ